MGKKKNLLNFILGIVSCILVVFLAPKYLFPKMDTVFRMENLHPGYAAYLSPGAAVKTVSPDGDTNKDYIVIGRQKVNLSQIKYSDFQIFFNSLKYQLRCHHVTIAFDDGTGIEFVSSDKDEAYYGAYNETYEVTDHSVKLIDDGKCLRLSTVSEEKAEALVEDGEESVGIIGIDVQ